MLAVIWARMDIEMNTVCVWLIEFCLFVNVLKSACEVYMIVKILPGISKSNQHMNFEWFKIVI